MSIAIVSMTNHTAIKAEVEEFDDECDSSYDNSTDLSGQDGTFTWTTKTQGWVLSSFFYGYVLTQVSETGQIFSLKIKSFYFKRA